jgi:hypothetical protein
MTRCVKGPWSHEFPLEDAIGAYCERHGVALLFNPEPGDGEPEYLDDDLVCPEPLTADHPRGDQG